MTYDEKSDEALLRLRRFEPPSYDLAERIIASARPLPNRSGDGMIEWLSALLAATFPRPAFAVASVALMGIILGLSLPAQPGEDAALSMYMDDEGAIL